MKCQEKGCGEYARYEFDTRADYSEHYKRRPEWRCTRHNHPEEVLSPSNLKTVKESTNIEKINGALKVHNYWDGASGFRYGPGFKAYSEDFPPGTKLIVTAEIILPN